MEKWREEIEPFPPLQPFSPQQKRYCSTLSREESPCSSSTSRFSPYNKENLSFTTNLADIISISPKGCMLIEYYNKANTFHDEQRNMLINLICHYFNERNLHMSLANSYQLEKEICERFPTEKLVINLKN